MTKELFIEKVYRQSALLFFGIDITDNDIESLKADAQKNIIINNDKQMFAIIKNHVDNNSIAIFNLFGDDIIDSKFILYNEFLNAKDETLKNIAKYYEEILNKKYDKLEHYEEIIPKNLLICNVSEIIKTHLPV